MTQSESDTADAARDAFAEWASARLAWFNAREVIVRELITAGSLANLGTASRLAHWEADNPKPKTPAELEAQRPPKKAAPLPAVGPLDGQPPEGLAELLSATQAAVDGHSAQIKELQRRTRAAWWCLAVALVLLALDWLGAPAHVGRWLHG